MLIAFNGSKEGRHFLAIEGRLFKKRIDPRQPLVMVDLDLRLEPFGMIKSADGELDTTGMAIGQRRTARPAEAAMDLRR